MKPAPGVALFIIGNDGILFSERENVIYALNTTAAYIWCLLEDAVPLDRIIDHYSRTFNINHQNAHDQVNAVIDHLQEIRVLEGNEPNNKTPDGSLDNIGDNYRPTLSIAFKPSPVIESVCYRLLDTNIRINYTSPDQASWVHPVLAHLQYKQQPDVPECVIDIIINNDIYYIFCNEDIVAVTGDINRLAPVVKGLVIQTAVNNSEYFIYIHAGVVGINGSCLLLPARSGSGKSTLTAGLVASGFEYLTDEVALLEENSLRIIPAPLAIGIKSTGWDIIDSHHPDIYGLPVHHREDNKLVRYIPPPDNSAPYHSTITYPVKTIILPHYDPGMKTRLIPVSKVTALENILGDCLAIPVRFNMRNIEALASWISDIPCYQLTMSSLEDAIRIIRNKFC